MKSSEEETKVLIINRKLILFLNLKGQNKWDSYPWLANLGGGQEGQGRGRQQKGG